MKTVLANGCFDVFHYGHLLHLEAARELGDCLVVSLTIDEQVNKGPDRPVWKWTQRAQVLRALRCVDIVIPASNAAQAIRLIKPSIFVKGADYEITSVVLSAAVEACQEVGAEIRFTTTPKYSSTGLLGALRA